MSLRAWWRSLADAPEPLMANQRRALWIAGVLVATSRFAARGHSMWDWDEALFCLSVRNFDVASHHPHPPGYPLFVAAAKLVRLGTHSDFRALQFVVMAGAIALFPILFTFAREARFPFAAAFGGALIYVFLPNVWVYGGSVMSDIPAVALTLFACALLLRGCRSAPAYLLGALVLGAAAAVRPQALLIGGVPAVIATVHRLRHSWRQVAVAACLGAATIVAAYGGAALASASPAAYLRAVRHQQSWVHDVDSYHNPYRPPLRSIAGTVFLFPTGSREVEIVSILAVAGAILAIIARRGAGLLTMATFAPFAVFAWLMLDLSAMSRYAIGYMPMHALLAADLIVFAGSLIRRPRFIRAAVVHGGSAALALACAIWTWPALRQLRRNDAPPAAAMHWLQHNTYAGAGTLFIHDGFGPFADYFLPGYDVRFFEDMAQIPLGGFVQPAYIAYPGIRRSAYAHTWVRPHGRLWKIVRSRYFEATVVPIWDAVRYVSGWHDQEGSGEHTWRWMKRSGVIVVPPMPVAGRLTVNFYVPLDLVTPPPTIEVVLNGVVVERIVPTEADVRRSWEVPSRDAVPNELRLTTSATVIPARFGRSTDARELGLRMDSVSWRPAKE